MSDKIKMLVVSIVVLNTSVFSGLGFRSDQIIFRSHDNAGHTSHHYGDLRLSGGSSGPSMGDLFSNRIEADNGMGGINSNYRSKIYTGLDITNGLYVSGYSEFYDGIEVNDYATFNCDVTVTGELEVIPGIDKNFVELHPEDTTKLIKYSAVESGESLTLARGTSKTEFGRAVIDMPEHFSYVTSDMGEISVTLTPEDKPVLLYVTDKNRKQVVVLMKDSDYDEFGDVSFNYQVTGVRAGFEDKEIIVSIEDDVREGIKGKKYLSKSEKRRNKRTEKYKKRIEKVRNRILKQEKPGVYKSRKGVKESGEKIGKGHNKRKRGRKNNKKR